jgi:hypothetical protein
MKNALVFVFLFAIAPITAFAAEPLQPVLPLEPIIITRTLNVTINGLGNVISNPAGIDCTDGTGQCSHAFPINTSVALLATAPPADENGSYFFVEWSGDATGSVAAAAVVMDVARNVIAQFGALGVPVFVSSLPAGQAATFYHPVFEPVKNPFLEDCLPVAIEEDPNLTNIRIGLPPFDQAVDIYVGVVIDGIDDMFVFGPGSSIQLLSSGLAAWKQNLAAFTEVDEALLGGGVPTAALPAGTYRVFLMVTAAGSMSVSFAWETYFEITHVQLVNPFLLP